MSEAAQNASAAFLLDADVRNGGFDQFFWNADGENIRPAMDGLRALGAVEAATVVERAMQLVKKRYPLGMRASDRTGRDPDLDSLDMEYYAALPRRTLRSFESLLAAYVRAHIGDF
jgi:hypothetical protein